MTFAENPNRLCRERGTSLTAIVKQVKGSSSFTTVINKGSLPKEDEMIKMAELLHCLVADFFMDDKPALSHIEPQDEDEEDILRIYRSLSRRAKHEFMTMIYRFESQRKSEKDGEHSTL